MSTRSSRRGPLPALLLSLGVGVALGLAVGWLAPVQRVTTDFDRLHPDFKADYAVMVGHAYLLDGDWPVAEARLAALGESPIETYVGQLTESYIAQGRNLNDIRGLVALSVALGYTSPTIEPYLPVQVPGGQAGP